MFTRHDEAIWEKEGARAPYRHIHPNSDPICTKGPQLFQQKTKKKNIKRIQ